MKNDHRSKFPNLSNWKEKAWASTGFEPVTSALPVRCSSKTDVEYEVKKVFPFIPFSEASRKGFNFDFVLTETMRLNKM